MFHGAFWKCSWLQWVCGPFVSKADCFGGPVTVTHPQITRYFMTIPEVWQQLQASAMAHGGEVFVLDMGEPVRIADLARQMIQLSGFSVRDQNNPRGDIALEFSGLRPGEKLFEELLISATDSATDHPLILQAKEGFLPTSELQPLLARLLDAAAHHQSSLALELLKMIVPEYTLERPLLLRTDAERTKADDSFVA